MYLNLHVNIALRQTSAFFYQKLRFHNHLLLAVPRSNSVCMDNQSFELSARHIWSFSSWFSPSVFAWNLASQPISSSSDTHSYNFESDLELCIGRWLLRALYKTLMLLLSNLQSFTSCLIFLRKNLYWKWRLYFISHLFSLIAIKFFFRT